MCKGICNRFLKNIARWRGRTITGARRWKGRKDEIYDDRVYDFRVMKKVSSHDHNRQPQDYTRCTKCEIVLLRAKFPNGCPCCGNTRLTKSFRRGGR